MVLTGMRLLVGCLLTLMSRLMAVLFSTRFPVLHLLGLESMPACMSILGDTVAGGGSVDLVLLWMAWLHLVEAFALSRTLADCSEG